MRRLAILVVPLLAAAALAQKPLPAYGGTWGATVNGQTVSLDLTADAQAAGTYNGKLSIGDATSAVLASVEPDTGQLNGAVILQKAPDGKPTEFRDYLNFCAELNGPGLVLTLSLQAGPRQFEMSRAGGAPAPGPAPVPTGQGGLAGTFRMEQNGTVIELTLKPGADNQWSGTLTLGGQTTALVGRLDPAKGTIQGAIQLNPTPAGAEPKEFENYMFFVVEPSGAGVTLSVKLQAGERQFAMNRVGVGAPNPPAPPPAGQPGSLAGDYHMEQNGQVIDVSLKQQPDGSYAGTFTLAGQTTALVGKLDAAKGVLQGAIQLNPTPAGAEPKEFENYLFFVAQPTADGLLISVKLQAGERQFPLTRRGAAPAPVPGGVKPPAPGGDPIGLENLPPAGGTPAPAGNPTPGGGLTGLFRKPEPPKPAGSGLGGLFGKAQPAFVGEYRHNADGQNASLTIKVDEKNKGQLNGSVSMGGQTLDLAGVINDKGNFEGVIQLRKTAAGVQPKEYEDYVCFVAKLTADGLTFTVKFADGEQPFAFRREAKAGG